MNVRYKVFENGAPDSIEQLFEEAAAFASDLKPERLINIAHSHGEAAWLGNVSSWVTNSKRSVVTVWYWDEG